MSQLLEANAVNALIPSRLEDLDAKAVEETLTRKLEHMSFEHRNNIYEEIHGGMLKKTISCC
jgi:hypothetical protein